MFGETSYLNCTTRLCRTQIQQNYWRICKDLFCLQNGQLVPYTEYVLCTVKTVCKRLIVHFIFFIYFFNFYFLCLPMCILFSLHFCLFLRYVLWQSKIVTIFLKFSESIVPSCAYYYTFHFFILLAFCFCLTQFSEFSCSTSSASFDMVDKIIGCPIRKTEYSCITIQI